MKKRDDVSLNMNRKAQFYLIAAAIISVLLVGLAATINYASISPVPVRFYDMGEEYNLETARLIDYGTYSQNTNIIEKIQNFTDQFYITSRQKDPEIEIMTLYGNSTAATFYNYAKNETKIITSANKEIKFSPKEVLTEIGYQPTSDTLSTVTFQHPTEYFWGVIQSPGQTVKIQISNTNYTVELKEDQNFYFVIMSRKASGEVTVKTG